MSTYRDPNERVAFKDRLGNCYRLAAQYAIANRGKLIHGSIEGMGKPRLDHAWVELDDGSVWEPTLGQLFDANIFEIFASPIVHTRYNTWQEASLLALHTEHWGPWEKEDA